MLRSRRLPFSLVLLTGVLRAFSGLAQAPTVVTANGANAVPIPGAGHDYIHLLSETVDPSSGNVSVTIPFPTRPGRGITFPLTAYLSQPPYQITSNITSGQIEFEDHPYPTQAEVTWTENTYQAGVSGGQTGTVYVTCNIATAFTFTGLDDVSHNLSLSVQQYNKYVSLPGGLTTSQAQNACGGAAADAGVNEGGDGIEINAAFSQPSTITQPDVTDWEYSNSNSHTPVTGPVGPFTVSDQAGNTFFFDGNGTFDGTRNVWVDYANTIEDRNGNQIKECGTVTYCDTSGQGIGIIPSASGSSVSAGVPTTYSTEGTANVTYTVPSVFQSSPNFTCDYSQSSWIVPATGGPPAPVIPGEITIGFGTPAGGGNGSLVYYQLFYGDYGTGPSNHYGLLNKIVYPDGGTVEYTYPETLPSGTLPNAQSQMTQVYEFGGVLNKGAVNQESAGYGCFWIYTTPQVSTRVVSFDGGDASETQTFSYSADFPGTTDSASDWTSKFTSVTTQDNVTGKTYLTTYTYAPMGGGIQPLESYGGSSSQVPVEQVVTHYAGATAGTAILETETKGWYDQFHLACDLKTLPNGTTGHFYIYDQHFHQISDDKEYDYGIITNPSSVCSNSSTGVLTWSPPATPTRETVTTFQSFTNVLGTTFGKPSKVIVCYNASTCNASSEIAETDYVYDQSAVVPVTTTNHDSQFTSGTPPPQPTPPLWSRGNATSVTKVCLAGCTSNSVTQYSYDQAGQVVTSIDPCGFASCGDMPGQTNHSTTYVYDPTYDTYLTSITRPTPSDGVAQTENYHYNYTNGQVIEKIDENSQPTQYDYDTILRLQDVYSPASSQNGGTEPHTHYVYEDGSGATITRTDPIGGTTVTIEDGLGHPLKTKVSYPTGEVQETDTSYDGMGQPLSVSNPYISTSDLSYGTTVYAYDGLGRVIEQCQPDNISTNQGTNNTSLCLPQNSYLSWNYANGNQVVFTDENGNKWARTTDGLGRLTQVLEPSSTGSTTIETDYQYDGLNNLLQVDQWGGPNGSTGDRQRKFSYDSLSRLILASNPETGTTCYGTGSTTCVDGYDANGNLSVKQDARGVVTHFSYDALNRLVAKTSTGALSCCFSYDGKEPNGVGRLENEWTQSGSCPSIPSSFTTDRQIISYDELGRVTEEEQAGAFLWYGYDLNGNGTSLANSIGAPSLVGAAISTSSAPNLAGAVTQPTGLLLTTTYDTASHMTSVASNWSAYPEGVYSLATNGYSAVGPANWTLDNGQLTVTESYTKRLRVNNILATGPLP